MALSPTVTSMCDQLVQKYNGIIDPVKTGKSGFKSLTRSLISQMSTANYSAIGNLETEMGSLETQLSGVVPGDDDDAMTDLNDFIQNCPFFDQQTTGVSAVKGSSNGVFDRLDEFIDGSSSSFDEFGLAQIADNLNKLLDGSGFPNGNNLSQLLKDADILIQCLSGLCPGYEPIVISYQDDVNGLYDEMHIVSNPVSPNYGLLDYDYLYSTANLEPTQISNMNYTIGGVTDLKSSAKTSIDSSVQAVKNALNLGSIF